MISPQVLRTVAAWKSTCRVDQGENLDGHYNIGDTNPSSLALFFSAPVRPNLIVTNLSPSSITKIMDPMDQDMDTDTGLVPNPLQRHERKAQIQQFLASLSPEEARHVARQLANTDFRTDIVAGLPAELLLIVAKYVDPEDIYNFTNVRSEERRVGKECPV